MEFQKRLRDCRISKGLSQRKAAKDLYVSQALLSHYENGRREPGLPFLCHACDYYGVTADYLLGRSDIEENDIESLAASIREFANKLEQYIGK